MQYLLTSCQTEIGLSALLRSKVKFVVHSQEQNKYIIIQFLAHYLKTQHKISPPSYPREKNGLYLSTNYFIRIIFEYLITTHDEIKT